ncbi:hypothetical protein [Pseudothioclava nitratireducens]|jgi:hypothetical protein|uniref:hypothetical protein n=1 Tax=Pseudothioclava nitratireducens TaxID=1928646 RepID=UPI0023DB45B5|nr:hypothetical protein [Defluviimonas nitratireducens]MDF1619995.1 hypothetical protein [Defluviimonas nitratireducens]
MAFTSAIAPRETGLLATIFAALAGVGAQLLRYAERRARLDELDALRAKSDAELAAMGLRRDSIAQHVFRDRFYI